MEFTETRIAGAWTIDPTPYVDERGHFLRAWCVDEFAAHGIAFEPVQANMGHNHRAATLRGLHFQLPPHEEGKLVRCTRGSVYDVLVDLRPGSPTAWEWFGTELTAENGRMLYVPPMCAHGYLTLEAETEIYYLTSARYAPEAASGLRYDDPVLGITWPRTPECLSEQDLNWTLLDPNDLRITP